MTWWRSCVRWSSRSSCASDSARRAAPTWSASTTWRRSPTGSSRSIARFFETCLRDCPWGVSILDAMLERLKELFRHSAIYGLGSIVARILAVLLLPLYTRYLSPSDYGLIETLVALSAVLTALVAQAMKSAFFRFYFDSAEPERRLLVVRTAFWYVFAASTAVLVAGVALAQPISWVLFHTRSHDGLVVAAFIGLWAAMNYEQITSLFRVEQRSTAYVIATLANVGITIAATVLLFFLMIRRPPRSTLFPLHDALPIYDPDTEDMGNPAEQPLSSTAHEHGVVGL